MDELPIVRHKRLLLLLTSEIGTVALSALRSCTVDGLASEVPPKAVIGIREYTPWREGCEKDCKSRPSINPQALAELPETRLKPGRRSLRSSSHSTARHPGSRSVSGGCPGPIP
jgi:hypothetical protein